MGRLDVSADVQVIVVMRHGERSDDAPDALTLPPGTGSDGTQAVDPVNPPLTCKGATYVEQGAALALHDALRALYGPRCNVPLQTISSPFLRCLQTADAISNGMRRLQASSSHEPADDDGEGSCRVDGGVEVDFRLSEVCGPVRVKGIPPSEPTTEPSATLSSSIYSRMPKEHSLATKNSRKGLKLALPVWGEGVRQAQVRYVGALRSLSRGLQRHHTRNAALPRHALLVTHGDAISSVVSAIYPSLTVYEVKYGGFVILEKLLTPTPGVPLAGPDTPLLDCNRFRIVHVHGVEWLDESFSEDGSVGIKGSFTKEARKPVEGDAAAGDSSDSADDSDSPAGNAISSPTSPTASRQPTCWLRMVPPAVGVGLACGLAQAVVGVASSRGNHSQRYASLILLAVGDLLRSIHLLSIAMCSSVEVEPRVSLGLGQVSTVITHFGKRFGVTFDRALENETLNLLSRLGIQLSRYHVLSHSNRTARPNDRSPLIGTSVSARSKVHPALAVLILVGLKALVYLAIYNGGAMLLTGIVAAAGPDSWRVSCWDAYFEADVGSLPSYVQSTLFVLNLLLCFIAVLGLVRDRLLPC